MVNTAMIIGRQGKAKYGSQLDQGARLHRSHADQAVEARRPRSLWNEELRLHEEPDRLPTPQEVCLRRPAVAVVKAQSKRTSSLFQIPKDGLKSIAHAAANQSEL